MNEKDKSNLSTALKNFLISDDGKQPDISEAKIMELLIEETLKFRDKMINESAYTVTIKDTKIALMAVDAHVQNEKTPEGMTNEQTTLAKLMIDRLILLKINL